MKRTVSARSEVRRLAAEVAALRQLVDALTLTDRLRGLASRVALLEAEKTKKAG